jgi:hypothetical protein
LHKIKKNLIYSLPVGQIALKSTRLNWQKIVSRNKFLKKGMTLIKYFIITICSLYSIHSRASVAKNSTVYAKCTRTIITENNKSEKKSPRIQTIIFASETVTIGRCQDLGSRKAKELSSQGWTCTGKNQEISFSCENEPAPFFAKYQGETLDRLTFTNKQKHRGILAYLNPNSIDLCREDKTQMVNAGVTDANCHKRNH